MRQLFGGFILGAFLLLTGCAFNAQVSSTDSAVSEIRTDKQTHKEVTIFISDDLSNLKKDVKPSSFVCSANKYPLDVGPALKLSIRHVMDGAFSNVYEQTSAAPSDSSAPYHFTFRLDSFEPRLTFTPGFWSASISASAELVMKVEATDSKGKIIVRTTVSGDGMADGDGQCPEGAQILALATQKAIKRTLENFIDKMINSDYFVADTRQ